MFTEEASFSDNLAGHDETTTMSESKIREAISLKEFHISHPHYFQLVLGPSYQSPELLPPQQLSGERIAPGKNRFVGS